MKKTLAIVILSGLSGGIYAAPPGTPAERGADLDFYRNSVVPAADDPAPRSLPEPSFSVSGCFVSANGGLVNGGVMNACIAGSRILWDNAPRISSPGDILEGNLAQPSDLQLSGAVACEFTPMTPEDWSTTGISEKFRCYHVNSDATVAGRYFNTKGELVPEAASVGAGGSSTAGLLLDAGGRAIMNSNGKPHKAERLKVKYYLGEARMREPFTETASTRLFWALGIPADHVFFPAQIVCHGCLPNPYQAKQAASVQGSQTFQWASIEKNSDGEVIRDRDDKGWEWNALRLAARQNGQLPQFEVLLLASRLVALSRPKPLQNKTRCASVEKNTGQCRQVYSYVADLGSSFGRYSLMESPRGELKGYLKQNVFVDRAACTLDESYLGHVISEEGRSLMSQRLLAAFGDATGASIDSRKVRAVFEAARFAGIDMDPADNGELDAWTGKLVSLMHEVLTARCPAAPGTPY